LLLNGFYILLDKLTSTAFFLMNNDISRYYAPLIVY